MKKVFIDNVEDERLDFFYRKDENKLKVLGETGVFIAESDLVINRALKENYEPLFFLVDENEVDKFNDIFNRCKDDIEVYVVKDEIFRQLKGYILLRSILACFKRKEVRTINEICKNAKRIVVLDEVVNPTNVGAIFRNAAALYADGVLMTKNSCDPLYRRSIRTSMGNVFKIPFTYVDSFSYIDSLHELGFKTVALALKDDCYDIDDERLINEDKLAIILGSEGYGLKQEIIDACDYVCKIAMNPSVDSLNVASASGIALWQLCKNNQK